MLTSIKQQYHQLCLLNHVDVSHGVQHACAVLEHVQQAMCYSPEPIPPSRQLSVELAALLHDADDRKYFQTKNYENARAIMNSCDVPDDVAADTIRMIDWVSGSKNGNTVPLECVQNPELLWTRWADRIEAIGTNGVIRCWQYNVEKKRLISSDMTPRPETREEALSLVTTERFMRYQATGESASMVDHYYDKLLHVVSVTPDMVQNSYLEAQLRENVTPLLDVCLAYTNGGDQGVIDHIRALEKELR